MTAQERIEADKLRHFMLDNNLDKTQVATMTHSGVRSVARWEKVGIPVLKWDLLQMNARK